MTYPTRQEVTALVNRLLAARDNRARVLALNLSRASTEDERVSAYAEALAYFPTPSMDSGFGGGDEEVADDSEDG
jgi:hypothetical protein